MKIYLSEYINPKAVERITARAEIVTTFDAAEELDAIIIRAAEVPREVIARAKKLKVIGKHGVGYNTIDIEAAREHGVRVIFTPGTNTQSVAELIVGLMLDVSRNISRTYVDCMASKIEKIGPAHMIGGELGGKTLGLIGVGNISRRVAEILRAGFQMEVVGYDAFLPEEKWREFNVTRCGSVAEAMAKADFLSISVPLTKETTNLIGEKELRGMKKTAVLVNASRGGIVNEDALYTALKEGWIRAAASDVFDVEPPTAATRLYELPNFVGTPHIGGNTVEATERVGLAVVADVFRVLDGLEPLNPVV